MWPLAVFQTCSVGPKVWGVVWCFVCQALQGGGGLFSVLVALDGVDPHFLVR